MLIVLETSPVFDVLVHAESGAAANADTTPTCAVYEDASDTPILTPTVVSRGVAGSYRVTVAATAANGFEAGKTYNVVATAVVGGVTVRARVATFTAVTSLGATQASVDAIDDLLDTEMPALTASMASAHTKLDTIDDFLDTEIAAIKAKTDNLPSDPADESNILAAIAAIPAAPSAAVIADAVLDEALAGHVAAGSAGEAIGRLDAAVTTRASQTSLDTLDDYVDTEVAAIKAKTDNLPADPADASDVATRFTTLDAAVAAVKVDTAAALVELAKILGLSSENTYRDTTVYDGDGNLTSARLRAYDSAANATTHGATGLLYTWTFTATYSGPGAMTSMLLVAA